MDLIKAIESEQMKDNTGSFRIGDTVKVHFKIVEGTTERIQVFEGIVIAINNKGISKTFTVRKITASASRGFSRYIRPASQRWKLSVTEKSVVPNFTTCATASERPPR